MFGLGGRPASATVLERRLLSKGYTDGGSFSTYEYMLDVRPDDATLPFRATAKDPFNMSTWRQPIIGDVVRVTYHGSGRKVKWDRADPLLRQDTPQQAGRKAVQADHTPEAERRWAELAAGGPVHGPTHDMSEERAAAAALPKPTGSAEFTATAEAIRQAKAAGDLDEVERLKAEFKRRAADRLTDGR